MTQTRATPPWQPGIEAQAAPDPQNLRLVLPTAPAPAPLTHQQAPSPAAATAAAAAGCPLRCQALAPGSPGSAAPASAAVGAEAPHMSCRCGVLCTVCTARQLAGSALPAALASQAGCTHKRHMGSTSHTCPQRFTSRACIHDWQLLHQKQVAGNSMLTAQQNIVTQWGYSRHDCHQLW